jgi:hypothetical protein
MRRLSETEEEWDASSVIADTLLDYVEGGAGWRFAATSLETPLETSPVSLLPAESLKERSTPDSYRVAGSFDRTGYFRVGKDVWHPGHGVGLRLFWRATAKMRLCLRVELAPINHWVTSFATCAVFLNQQSMLSGRCEARGFVSLTQIISVDENDIIDIVFGYDGVIDHLDCVYRATLEKDDLSVIDENLFFDDLWARRLVPLTQRLGEIVDRELEARGVELGQAGFFSARNR